MQIGQAAQASGISAKMIRHYETIGLIPSASRRDSNYRDYSSSDVHQLSFIRRARALGFSIDEIRDLLRLWADGKRSSREVKQLAFGHIEDLNGRIVILQEIRDTLLQLANSCDGNHRPNCPIIDELEGRNKVKAGIA